jgi:protein O-GlcNAc transferase
MTALGLAGQTQPVPRNAAEWIARGNADLDRYFFNDAETDFRKAIALDGGSAKVYVYLTRALLGQLAPNLHIFPDVQNLLPKAERAIQEALELSPSDAEATCVRGVVNYKIALTLKDPVERARRLDAARRDYSRALELDAGLAEAHYELGDMVLDQVMMPIMAARTLSGVKPGQPGPIADAKISDAVRMKYGASVEDALTHTERALQIKPDWEPAVNQMAGLLLTRAILRENRAGYDADVAAANIWQRKREEIAAKRANTAPRGVLVINGLPSVAPPAPPPPPHLVQ